MDSFLDIDKNIYVLGTDEGKIFRIIDNQKYLLYEDFYKSEVRSIRKIRESDLIIAFSSGNIIFLIDYSNSCSILKIRDGDGSKYDRIYDLEVLNDNTIYFSSNYGKIYKLFEEKSNWVSIQIDKFHGSNAIFCLDKLKDNIFITCDYGGGVVIWEVTTKQEKILYQINTFGNIQCVACSPDMTRLAMVHRTGMFLIFQNNGESFDLILEHEYPNFSGKKILYSDHDDSFVFNTKKSFFKYTEGSLFESNLRFIGNIEKIQEKIFILDSNNEIKSLEDIDFHAVDKLETFKLLNVGLIGHTGVGKSTLCDKFGDIEKESDLSSTSHRKLWIHKEDNNKYIFFNDIAGQLELIPTLIPSLKRSDFIFALFKSNDSKTLDILIDYIHLLRVAYKFHNKIFLIRTFYNEDNLESSHSDLIGIDQINEIVEKYNLEPLISIDRDNFNSLEHFIMQFRDSINWEKIKDWILSMQQKVFLNYLRFHLNKDLEFTTLTDICNLYEELDENGKRELNLTGFYGFDRSAVKSLLLRYKDNNLMDVIKKDDLILILNSKLFRKIKIEFYKTAKENMGFVNLVEIKQHLSNDLEEYEDQHLFEEYITYYDNEFLNSNTWLENKKNQRIFWSLIKNENLENVSRLIQELRELPDGILEKFILDLRFQINLSQKQQKLCNLELLMELLKKDLIAEKLSKTRGYWRNKEKTFGVYYVLHDSEENTLLTYYIFSNSSNHENALYIDNYFRSYFINIGNHFSYYSRNASYFINNSLYEKYVGKKKEFFNSNLNSLTVKYERFQDITVNKKILILFSNPIDNNPLRSESEVLKIKEILEETNYNRENYKILPHCSIEGLKEALSGYDIDLFYFSGHSDENSIFLENNYGKKNNFDALEFIELIETTNISEIYLNSCKSSYILELKQKPNLKCIGYNRDVPDFQVRNLGINFFKFQIRYGFDFYESIDKSIKYIENQAGIGISYVYKS